MPVIDPISVLPPLAEMGRSRGDLIATLSSTEFPSAETAVAIAYAHLIEADLVAIIERARHEDLDEASKQLFFSAVHVLGGRRLASGYRPLIAFLREAGLERIDDLLGDSVTDTLPRVLAGLCDGDAEPLHGLILDLGADEFVRQAALGTLAFRTFDGGLDPTATEAFLERYETQSRTPAGDMAWYGWMVAAGLLGLERLEPRVVEAFRDGRVPPRMVELRHYRQIAKEARKRPADAGRFEKENLGYIEDLLTCLQELWSPADGPEPPPVADDPPGRTLSEILAFAGPARNPYRDVGRNDPCPCGLGKKFKRCCGA